jgi:hypothetical protein
MPRAAEARAWWADVEDLRERIERRQAREGMARVDGGVHDTDSSVGMRTAAEALTVRRGVREIRPGRRLMLVETAAPPPRVGRRRPRPRPAQRVGPRPDRIASWAVALGFVLVLVALLSAHG